MGQRAKSADRCPRCRLHQQDCVCAEIPRIDVATKLSLVMHFRELNKTSSTGALALLALVNSTLYVHGRQNAPLDLDPLLDEGRRLLLLFPAEDALILTPSWIAQDPRPIHLIVPDGNWNQANRIPKRVAALRQVQRVVLAPGAPSRWGVRQETRHQGLATFEAIARAYGILESAAVQAQLEALFDLVIERTFVARGDGAQRYFRAGSIKKSTL